MKFRYLFFFTGIFIQSFLCSAQQRITLEQVIALALEKNYNIQLSKNAQTSAQTDESYIIGAFLPQINAVGSDVWNSNHQRVEFSDETRNNEGDARSNTLNGSVQLSWLLFDGTRMFATKQRVEEIAAKGELLVKDEMVNSIAEVIANYYDVVRGKQQLKAIQEQIAVSEERVKLAERKLQVGTGGKPELLQAKVDYNEQRTQTYTQRTLIGQLKQELNGLVGMQLPLDYDVADTIIINLDLRKEDIAYNLENTNFSLLAAQKDISIANQIIKERKGERYPFLYLNSNYNFTKNENTVAINNFSPLFSQSKGFNYGFSVTFPIINNLNNRRLIKQAGLNRDRQLIVYEQQKASVNVRLEAAYINYQNAKEVMLIEEENISLARENVFIALEGFKRGVTTFIELRTAQQSLEDANFRLIAARYIAKLAETELLRISGGLLR